MHPECALLEYHHNSIYSSDPTRVSDTPSAHIGTSNDPCYACRAFFAAYKDKPPDFSLQLNLNSATNKISPARDLWLPPRLESIGADIEQRFATLLLDDYQTYWVRNQEQDGWPKYRDRRFVSSPEAFPFDADSRLCDRRERSHGA
jgi:hypothetical protein